MDYKSAYLHLFNDYTDLLKKLESLTIDVRKAQVRAEMICTQQEEPPPISLKPKE